jgi:diadenosine tetraphosphatase ApaH/serine/threonine PP2A family protein phosphatase
MRIAVVSDIHANLPALEAVLDAIDGAYDRLWVTGDIVGYGAEPDAVVERLRALDAIAVRGNHDHVAAGNGGAEWFNAAARAAVEWTAATIVDETRSWLTGLPLTRDQDGWQLVHGSPRDPLWEYIDDLTVAGAAVIAMTMQRCVFGHTHVPVALIAEHGHVAVLPVGDGTSLPLDERRTLLNPGSVGQPRDGDPRASYMVIDAVASRATWHRVPYDIETAASRIRAAGLPDGLASRLVVGR